MRPVFLAVSPPMHDGKKPSASAASQDAFTKKSVGSRRPRSLKASHPLSPKSAEELEAAFLHFVDATRELETSQQRLSQEIYRLTEDLAKSNKDLKLQIEAKGRLAEELSVLLAALPTGVIIVRDGVVYACNEISKHLASDLKVGLPWELPRHWTVLDDAHFRANDGRQERVIRTEHRNLPSDRELILLHDVTATFRAREAIEREAKLAAMGRMAAEIAHQLRTPLATATLYASHLSRESLDSEKRTSFAKQLGRQLAGLESLVSRMMSFLRNQQSTRQVISVGELIEDCRQAIGPLFIEKNVALMVEIQGGEHLLSVQLEQLKGGIISLLENALQVSSSGQAVQLEAQVKMLRLNIVIRDEGQGIPRAILERLFEPFSTDKPGGTGLGLSIAKAAIEAHRGELHASNRDNLGAEFQIVLPVFAPL
ncbi:MAG: sensor histidine kinase [Betaproteobacteria bacterium]|nr:sensor histidine kinase [Betaproteobacteria bacterium]NBT05246.1 sensor histidine kinase [Betaproteobacteria bacterium]NCY07427.1 sensor histidine kinase [Betaproteobacteria bacterium]NDE53020.1 sensor histidine kinase [Actinomycetota bacterium]